jgi:phosphatidylethanolamine-binding protein (PEBP) family uncharacterized protein
MVWVHWIVYNMPPGTKSLPENASEAQLPQGALLGLNDFNPHSPDEALILARRAAIQI